MPARPRLNLFGGRSLETARLIGAQFERERNACLVQVETKHTTTIRLEKLDRELARPSPSPITTTDSPSVGSASRTPCNAIAPNVPYAPASKLTPLRQVHAEVLRHGQHFRM